MGHFGVMSTEYFRGNEHEEFCSKEHWKCFINKIKTFLNNKQETICISEDGPY